MRRSIFVLLTTLTWVAAQPAAQAPVSFEAASVKVNKSADNSTSVGPRPGGRFNAENAPLALLITMAYQLQPFQLQAAPDWTRTDRFDIAAKLDGDPPPVPFGEPDRMMLALRTLLADRFRLAAHWETPEMPAYALVRARADGKLGPNLHRSSTDCEATRAASREAAREGRVIDANTSDHVACGVRNNNGLMQFGGYPLSLFANALANQVARVVIDRTGLTGNWDFELTFTPERVRQQALAGNAPAGVDPNGPSIFTAIQEQLGLKLESTRAPVKVLVIDHAERPSPD
jgi:bla regulator protein blaR1